MSRLVFVFSGYVLLLPLFPTHCFAHENNRVHRGMSENAVLILLNSLITKYQSDIIEGSVNEDDFLRTCYHAYNPVNGRGWDFPLGCGTARAHAKDLWNQALQQYSQGNCGGVDGAYYLLGRAMHLVQDMTSPGHVHSDAHIFGDNFEDWGVQNFQKITPVQLGDPFIRGIYDVEDFVYYLADWTYQRSTFGGEISSTNPQNINTVFVRMFPSLHCVDGGVLGCDYWMIDNVGRYDPQGLNNEWWPSDDDYCCDNQPTISGRFYVENSGGQNGNLIPSIWPPNSSFTPNSKPLRRIWGDELYPDTIRYCVTLLQLFIDTIQATDCLGNLQVILGPQAAIDAGAMWRRRGGDHIWRPSGHIEYDIESGLHTVEFFPGAGGRIGNWLAPSDQSVQIRIGIIEQFYRAYEFSPPPMMFGNITVSIFPSEANSFGAAWRVVQGVNWYSSGFRLTDLPVGSYTLEFRQIADWAMDSYRWPITISKGENSQQGTYRCVPLAKDLVYVDRNYSGQFEKGTDNFPFKTIQKSTPFVNSGGRLVIMGGNYPENPTFQNKLILEAKDGVVVIGR